MTYLDKTFCASPRCQNKCGRKMTEEQKKEAIEKKIEGYWFGFFCEDENIDACTQCGGSGEMLVPRMYCKCPCCQGREKVRPCKKCNGKGIVK